MSKKFTENELEIITSRLVDSFSSVSHVSKSDDEIYSFVLRGFGLNLFSSEDTRAFSRSAFIEKYQEQATEKQRQRVDAISLNICNRVTILFDKETLDFVVFEIAKKYFDKFNNDILDGRRASLADEKAIFRDARTQIAPRNKSGYHRLNQFLSFEKMQAILYEYFDDLELEKASGRLDVLAVLEQSNPNITQPLVSLMKKYYFEARPGKTLDDTAVIMKEKIKEIQLPEEIKELLFSRSWISTIAFSLKRHFSEEEKKLDSLFPIHSAKHLAGLVRSDQISNRLGAGGIRDLVNQALQMPSGAGGHRPRDKYSGVNRPKPPRNG